MMSQDIRLRLHRRVLMAALIIFTQDLSSGGGGGAQAWTYNYSIAPKRRWPEARQWCQKHFTDLVPIRSQEETDYLHNLLPFTSKYYWIGIQKVNATWRRAETNETVPADAQNWAADEPDSIEGQDCVEIYIKRDTDTGKWNNENCEKKKATVCYSASCTRDSCRARGECVETIGSFTCRCHPGFHGPRCEEAEQCPVLNHTDSSGGSMNCSHPFAPHSYNSTCEVRCDEGYELRGDGRIRCDRSGQWTASVPACTKKKCGPIFSPAMGNVTCADPLEPFSFGSRCDFTCQEGFDLRGSGGLTCLASGQWSNPAPTCAVVRCSRLEAPPHASMQCQGPWGEFCYDSACTVRCHAGFELIGTNRTECSSRGNWSHSLPVCQAKTCIPQSAPSHGSISCSGPNGSFRFGSRCTSACDEGFVLNGTAVTECTSLGTWSRGASHCQARPCPLLAAAAQHGRMNCSHPYSPFSFDSHCDFGCSEGFRLRGAPSVTCNSSGRWSQDLPTCELVTCEDIHAVSLPLAVNCSHPLGNFSFRSQCLFSCGDGFSLNGSELLLCSATGLWNNSLPNCTDDLRAQAAMLAHIGYGTTSVLVLAVLIILAAWLLTRSRKKGKLIMSEAPLWEERTNPAFEC